MEINLEPCVSEQRIRMLFLSAWRQSWIKVYLRGWEKLLEYATQGFTSHSQQLRYLGTSRKLFFMFWRRKQVVVTMLIHVDSTAVRKAGTCCSKQELSFQEKLRSLLSDSTIRLLVCPRDIHWQLAYDLTFPQARLIHVIGAATRDPYMLLGPIHNDILWGPYVDVYNIL
jgi:hypothetical protein